MGSILLIEEDKYCNYSRVLSKYYLAEAVQRKHGIFFASLDDDPQQLLRSVPRPVDQDSTKQAAEKRPMTDESDDMRIAFRYNQMPKVESEISGSSASSTPFYDLSTSIPESDLTALNVTCYEDTSSGLITALKQVATKDEFSKGDSGSNLLRICVNSFGSPLWYSDNSFGRALLTTLLQLKAIVRNTNSVCLLTIPGHLLNTVDLNLMPQIRNLVDISIEIESFAASDKETNPVFKDYHGLLHIRKLTAVYTLAAFCPETLDLAFKLKRKRFVIEKLHLPPELAEVQQEGSRPKTMGCASGSSGGGTGNHLLDF